MASATEALNEALRELKLMEDALDVYESTRDKEKLGEVTARMKKIGPKLKELCMMPECKTAQNAQLLISLSNGMKAAVARTKQLSSGGSAAPSDGGRAHSGSVSVPQPVTPAESDFTTRSGSVESTRSNTLSSSSDRSSLTRSSERSLTSSGSFSTIPGIPQKPPPLAGWLKKQGEKGLVKTFKKRYFAQKDLKLYYFKAESDSQPLGYIDLSVVISVTGVEKTPGAFDIATDKRVFHLQAASAADLLTWVEGIRAWRAFADTVNSPAAALNRRSVPIPKAPSQPPPPVPDSLDAAPAPPGAPYVLAGAFPPPRPSIAPSPDPSLTPTPTPSPKPSMSPAPSPSGSSTAFASPVPASPSLPAPSPSPIPSPSPSASSSYNNAMKKSGEYIQRTATPSSAASTVSEPASAPTPLSDLLGGPPHPRSGTSLTANLSHQQPPPPSIATILGTQPTADPTPAPLSDLLGAPRSTPSTPTAQRSLPPQSPSTTAAAPSASNSTRFPSTPSERRLAGEVNVLGSPSFGPEKQGNDSLERELAAKTQQIDALMKELRKRDEIAKSAPATGVLATITATDKDGVVVQMEKMIRDLEISLRTKEQQNDDLKVQLAHKAEESRIKESKLESYMATQTRQVEELKSKDDAIAQLHDQIQNLKLTQGKQGELDERVRMELSKVRKAIAAHQAHNSFLESELSRMERENKAVVEAKQATVESLQRTLAEARHEHAMFRRKILLQKGADDKFLNELEDAKRELFSALALGIKLNMAMAGEAMTIDVTSLYDEAKDMDFRTWNDWVFRKIRDSLPPKQPVRRKTNRPGGV